jgi:hypothetical protein
MSALAIMRELMVDPGLIARGFVLCAADLGPARVLI